MNALYRNNKKKQKLCPMFAVCSIKNLIRFIYFAGKKGNWFSDFSFDQKFHLLFSLKLERIDEKLLMRKRCFHFADERSSLTRKRLINHFFSNKRASSLPPVGLLISQAVLASFLLAPSLVLIIFPVGNNNSNLP